MTDSDRVEASAPAPIPGWLPYLAGLIAAGVVAFYACRLPPVRSLSWSELIGLAIARMLAISLAAAATSSVLCAFQTGTNRRDTLRLLQRTSLDALWLAPLAFFIAENSAWSIAVAAVFVANVARILRSMQDNFALDNVEDAPDHQNMFGIPETWPWLRRQLSSSGAAFCTQTGALAALAGYPLTASLLVGAGSAVWTWSFIKYLPARRPARSRPVLIFALTLLLAVGALMGYLRNPARLAAFGDSSGNHERHGVSGDRHRQSRGEQVSEGGDQHGQRTGEEALEASTAVRDANTGIILWTKKETVTKLVAPAPAFGNGLLKTDRHANPLLIPFNGVYWFFKAPDLHPPQTSRQAQGSPEVLDIHSTDRRPLSMEAHEHLGSLIDLDCCGRIQIAIRNADTYSETVSLELILINSSLPGKPSQSLGSAIVRSTRPWSLFEEKATTSEMLNFAVPANPTIHRFDEMKVVFRLDPFRADDGAKVAIDHFVLIPRGL